MGCELPNSLDDVQRNKIISLKNNFFNDILNKSSCSFEGFCFLLGAGASTEAGLPEWDVLVENLCKKYELNINVDKNKVVEIVGAIESKIIESMSDIAEYAIIEKYICKLANYDEIRKVLYRVAVKRNIALSVQHMLSNSAKPNSSNGLMNTISQICLNRTVNSLRTSIVTYNYDDYLEYSILDLINKLGICQYKKNDIWRKIRVHDFTDKQLPCVRNHECFGTDIYHVHGHLDIFLDSNEEINSIPYPGCDKGIILSSDDYLELSENGTLSWTNQVQHSLFSSMPIIVIGFSMDDSNFRLIIRRLQQAKMMRQHIIIFLGHNGTDEKIRSVETGRILINELLKNTAESPAADTNNMVDIITCQYNDIPNILKYFFQEYFK